MAATIVAATLLSLLAVGLHYEALVFASAVVRGLPPGSARFGVALALAAHIVEVIFFGVGWYWLIKAGVVALSIESPTMLQAIYFSGAVYTSLGFGDIVPVANGEILAVSEAVTGLVLIGWTASFTFFQMRERWEPGRG